MATHLNGTECIFMCLSNTRSWNGHLANFISDKIYSSYSSLSFFTETNINDSLAKNIDETLDNWKDIHRNAQHSMAFCYNVCKLNIIEEIEIPSVLEVLPIALEMEKETISLVIVYRMPGPLGSFKYDFTANTTQDVDCW